jgi:hypothetical protein
MPTEKLPSPVPVRPLDPTWLGRFLSTSQMDKKMIKRVQAALGKYNKACNKAAITFEEDLKNLTKG